jgi:hypothetical protein
MLKMSLSSSPAMQPLVDELNEKFDTLQKGMEELEGGAE